MADSRIQMNGNESEAQKYEMTAELRQADKVDDPLIANPATSAIPPAADPKKLNPALIICIWIALSSSVILYNKAILYDLKFPYPIFLTTWHLTFATIGTRIMLRTTHLLDGVYTLQMSWDRWLRNIVPIGALFSASLVFSNMAYLTLSVSFIQMLKAFVSVAVLGMSVLMGLETPTQRTLVIVVCISLGVALASFGEIDFVLSGFICQALGIVFEAARLVAIQKLLHGLKMDPLVSLYYFAPVCASLNALLIPVYEGMAPFQLAWEQLGPLVLVSNATCAFCLNIAVVFLIGCASSLTLTLSGVIKDILLVLGSVLILGSTVTLLQMIGYSIALLGLVAFKTKKEVFDQYVLQAKSMLGMGGSSSGRYQGV